MYKRSFSAYAHSYCFIQQEIGALERMMKTLKMIEEMEAVDGKFFVRLQVYFSPIAILLFLPN